MWKNKIQKTQCVGLACLLWITGCDVVMPLAPPDSGPRRDTGAEMNLSDADGDGIPDLYEGMSSNLDTDGDGTPDYQDNDSDGDGRTDSTEGNVDASSMPADSDSDGTPDFQDLDSDDNGIPDASEADGDIDANGDPDYRDLDDDGDGINDSDEIGDAAMPIDTDADGLPDFQDVDSDNDTISDRHESIGDTDMDGVPDRRDLDSDSDGIDDSAEAGDADLSTPPVDTDADGLPDFRDPDSDDDGLSDSRETELGTNPANADTDGDGVTDLVEVAGCPDGDMTCADDATNPSSNPRARGDFVFFEPYMAAPDPMMDTLVFSTDLQVADVYFLIDTTGSMSGPIGNVRSSLSTAGSGIIDQIRAEIPDTWFGVGEFKDYPVSSYGTPGSDIAYRNRQDLSDDTSLSQSAVNSLSASGGADGPESHGPALWATATGMALPGNSGLTSDRTDCPMGHFGYPCFRPTAVPIVIMITDIQMHNDPSGGDAYDDSRLGGHAPTYMEVIDAANAARVRLIGVATGSSAEADLRSLATDTGAVDGSGSPLVSRTGSSGVGTEVVNQVRTLANQTPIDISVSYQDDETDTVDTYAAFIERIVANTAGDSTRGCEAREAEDTDMDGFPDTFRNVTPGTPVCFDIVVKQNDTVMPAATPQLLRGTLQVIGDGFTPLGEARDIFFLVPPEIVMDTPT